VGPRKSNGRPRAKGYCGVGMMLRQPKFMSRGKTSSAVSDGHSSSDELIPIYIDTSEKSSLDGLPESLASFDPHKFKPGEFLKRFRARRYCDKARETRSGAPSVESVIEEKTHSSETLDKE
jgi:hypothetical protein